jgi:hypothetical protein
LAKLDPAYDPEENKKFKVIITSGLAKPDVVGTQIDEMLSEAERIFVPQAGQ